MTSLWRASIARTAFAGIRSQRIAMATSRTMNYSSIATPERCYVDFCLIPVGTGTLSVAKEIAEVQRLLRESGLKYTMHSAGTTVGTLSGVFMLPFPSCVSWLRLTSSRGQLGRCDEGHWPGALARPPDGGAEDTDVDAGWD